MQSFSTDPTDPGTRIWRQEARPSSQFVITLAIIAFCLYFVGRLAVLMPRVLPSIPWWLTAMIFGVAVMGLFAAVTYGVAGWRTYRESREFAIRLTKKAIELTLPSPAFNGAVPLRDLGTVQSRAGVMGVWGARSAEWSAKGLNTAERKVTWARASRTAKLMPWIIFGLIAIRFVVRLFTVRS